MTTPSVLDSTINGSRPTRSRRTKSDIETIKRAIVEALEVDRPMSVRQVFYRLVSGGAIPKTEAAYKSTVVRILGDMRKAREIPFDWIADSTRWMRKPASFDSMEDALTEAAQFYRRDLWRSQESYVEVWLEKDALAGVLYQITGRWDVPLMVTRGYPSLSFLSSAADTINAAGKPTKLYYFGDHDPSGCDIPRAVEEHIREYAPDAELSFHRIAVNADQIKTLGLPTRPTKTTDSRCKGFEGGSVEVDAIPPPTLRAMAEESITSNIDARSLRDLRAIEAEERETLQGLAEFYRAKKGGR
jgi:hypothetical protein